MLDFRSALYLGWQHGGQLVPRLTTGMPAALFEPEVVRRVARQMARLQQCERATVGSSTLHLFWDLFGQLGKRPFNKRPFALFLDSHAYPVIQWGAERAAMHGMPLIRFPHQDAEAVAQLVKQVAGKYRPLLVSDGMCGGCGCTAPIADYLDIVRSHNGLLVLDDTQALGLLGFAPTAAFPYGCSGGGTLPHQAIADPGIVVVSSLAKSLGVPIAVLAGSGEMVAAFQANSQTRIHSSPPSLAVLHTAEQALLRNEQEGDARRQQLARNVALFRQQVARAGLAADGSLFPVQTLRLPPQVNPARMHQMLHLNGIGSVLRRGCNGRSAISFVITANHHPRAIKQAVAVLAMLVD